MRVTVSTALLTALLLSACGSSSDVPAVQEQGDQNSNSAPTATVTTLEALSSTTAVSEAPKTNASLETKEEPGFGAGGLVADLEAWANRDLPLFITASHIDVSAIERISLFRSNAGHDYSDSF